MPRRPKRTSFVDDTVRSRSPLQRTLPQPQRPIPQPMPRSFSGGSHGTSRRMHEHHYRQAEFERLSRARAALRDVEQEEHAAGQSPRRRRLRRATRRG